MKKAEILIICITIAFVFSIVGFFVGRSTAPGYQSTTTGDSNTGIVDGKIDLNSATAKQLALLPGIGDKIAENIVQYRQEHGPFVSVYDLLNVDLIGEKRLNDILDYITVVPAS